MSSPPKSPLKLSKSNSVRVAPAVTLIAANRTSHPSIRNLLSYTKDLVDPEIPVATKAWIIRVACGQIVHALDDMSDTLSHQLLQELCAELVVRSTAVIQSKVKVQVDQPSKRNENVVVPTNVHRQAEMVEKVSFSRPLSKRGINNNNKISPSIKSPAEEDPLQMFPDDDAKSHHSFYNYLTVTQRLDYLTFKRSDTNVPFVLFFYLSAFFFVITGFFWSNNMVLYQKHPTATISIVFAVLSAFFLFWIGVNHLVSLSGQYKLVDFKWYNGYVVKLYNSPYGQWPDNCACLFVALASGFYLVNIVIMNLCDTTTAISHNIVCLPTTVPPEAIIMTMLIVIMVQIVARGVSRIALVCSWIICLVAINCAISLSGNSNYVWINLLLLLIICVSYELERQPLCQFINTTKAMEAAKVAAELELQLSVYKTLLAAQALEAKRSLVRHIGHEIRTPLNVVGVGVDMLIKELEPYAATLPDGVMDIIEGIQEASSASLEVINELLEFEKLAAGMTTLECVPTPILPFLEQAMRQHLLPARSKEILFELLPLAVTRNVTVNIDPIKLLTVFRNIFSNAIKFTKVRGRVTIRVEIKRPSLNGIEMLVISVKDSGAGLSPENLLRLFGEGVQFNANGLQGGGGSGLGLFITKGIVLLHENAKIWAESEGEGKGCTFFVRVPVHSHNVMDPALTQSCGSPRYGGLSVSLADPVHEFAQIDLNPESCQIALTAVSLMQGLAVSDLSNRISPRLPLVVPVVPVIVEWKPTILVVDDSSMNRKMLVRSLVSRGFACCEAEDGLEALSEMSRSSNRSLSAGVSCPSPRLPISRLGSVGDASMAGGGGVGPLRNLRSEIFTRKSSGHAISNLFDPRSSQKQHYSIDAVLIDFNMPRMNGPDAIVEMRKIGFRGPIIGVSGGDEKTMIQFLEAGADNVIQKPAKTDTLVDILLTGLEMVVVFDETQQRKKPTTVSLMNKDKDMDSNMRDMEIVRQEHMNHLLIFLAETKAKAEAKALATLGPLLAVSP